MRSCQNCNDGCVGTLLDSVEIIQNHLGSIDLEDLDPAPMRKLTHYTNLSSVLDISVEDVKSSRDQVRALGELEAAIESEAELNLLEASKLAKTGETQGDTIVDLQSEASKAVDDVNDLDRKIKDMTLYLENHGKDRGSGVSITTALRQAADLLKQIQGKDFSEFDIKVRTELSDSRILLDTIEKLLFGEVEISSITEKTADLDSLVNDLLQYLNEGMMNVRMAGDLNLRNNRSLGYTQEKCQRIDKIISQDNQRVNAGKKMIKEGDKLFQNARDYFQRIIDLFNKLRVRADKLEAREIGMSAVVEDYRTRYVLPCQANAIKLAGIAEKIRNMFDDKVGVNADLAIKAANAYKGIIDGLDEARAAASAALDAAIEAYKVADPPGDNNLRKKARDLRFVSEDLRQEAQGLLKNADDMILQLHDTKLSIDKYKFNLDQNRKQILILETELQRHSYVTEYANEARETSTQALKQSTAAEESGANMIQRIKLDLRARADDLNSFSASLISSFDLFHIFRNLS